MARPGGLDSTQVRNRVHPRASCGTAAAYGAARAGCQRRQQQLRLTQQRRFAPAAAAARCSRRVALVRALPPAAPHCLHRQYRWRSRSCDAGLCNPQHPVRMTCPSKRSWAQAGRCAAGETASSRTQERACNAPSEACTRTPPQSLLPLGHSLACAAPQGSCTLLRRRAPRALAFMAGWRPGRRGCSTPLRASAAGASAARRPLLLATRCRHRSARGTAAAHQGRIATDCAAAAARPTAALRLCWRALQALRAGGAGLTSRVNFRSPPSLPGRHAPPPRLRARAPRRSCGRHGGAGAVAQVQHVRRVPALDARGAGPRRGDGPRGLRGEHRAGAGAGARRGAGARARLRRRRADATALRSRRCAQTAASRAARRRSATCTPSAPATRSSWTRRRRPPSPWRAAGTF